MEKYTPGFFQEECVNQIYELICDGKRRISVFIPSGAGKTLISLMLVEKICTTYQKAYIVIDNDMLMKSCKAKINQFGNKSVDCIDVDELLSGNISAELFILFSLRTDSRLKLGDFFGKYNSSIIVSFSEPFSESIENRRDQFDYVVNVEGIEFIIERNTTKISDSQRRLAEYYIKLGNITPMIYATESIFDLRDVSLASVSEKENLAAKLTRDKDNTLKESTELKTAALNLHDGKLEHIVSKMQNKLKFYEELLNSLGIPQETLDTEFERIESLRNSLQEKYYNEDGSINEEVITQFQSAVADSIVNCSKCLVTQTNNEIYTAKLIDSLTESVWNEKLSAESKTFLITAQMTYDSMCERVDKEELDYSGVCLLVTKSLDFEVAKRLYDRYVEYLSAYSYYDWPYALLNDDHTEKLSPHLFTLGKVVYVVGIDKYGNVKNPHNYDMFTEFARKKLYNPSLSDSDMKKRINELVDCVEKARNDFRNPSAHRNKLDLVKAQECMDYMLWTYTKMKEILIDMI